MPKPWAILLKPYVAVTLGFLAAAVSYLAIGYIDGAKKRADLNPAWKTGKVDLQVFLEFEPEKFHILTLQKAGRFAGYDQASGVVTLYDVRADELIVLSRKHWVTALAVAESN